MGVSWEWYFYLEAAVIGAIHQASGYILIEGMNGAPNNSTLMHNHSVAASERHTSSRNHTPQAEYYLPLSFAYASEKTRKAGTKIIKSI